jgi:hypothetical protein
VTHIYIKPSSNQCSTTSREASAAGRLRPNAVTAQVRSRYVQTSTRHGPIAVASRFPRYFLTKFIICRTLKLNPRLLVCLIATIPVVLSMSPRNGAP